MGHILLGRDHALIGAAGFLVVAPLLLNDPSWQDLGVGCVTSAAFALLPDIDEPGSTVSRKLGPISRSVSEVTNSLAGGHRQATHSLFFAALVGVATWLAMFSPITVAIIVAASFLLVFRMLLPRMLRYVPLVGIGSFALTIISADWAYHLALASPGTIAPSTQWLLLATAGGCLWHLVGDSMTIEGVPWLWLPGVEATHRFRVAAPIVGHTGSARESLIGGVIGFVLIWLAWALVLIPASHSVTLPSLHVPDLNPLSYLHTHVRIHLPNPAQLMRTLEHGRDVRLPASK